MMKHVFPSLLIVCTMIVQAYSDDTALMLEENIPFDVRISDKPLDTCDPLDLIVEVKPNHEFRWLVMDGEKVQCEFECFDDLYYQCDGPGCFMVRIKGAEENAKWHVCLK